MRQRYYGRRLSRALRRMTPKGALQIIYVEARDQVAVDSYVLPELVAFEIETISKSGMLWIKEVMNNGKISRSNLATAPQALNPAIGYTTFNLQPFGPPQVTPAVTVGLIYLIIVAFFSFAFFMSFSYSLVPLAFQVPFSNSPASHAEVAFNANAYGKASFVVFWMVNLVGMCALGFACENVAMVVGQPYTAVWLIFWVISNVCTAFYPIELAPRLYYYGYAFPLHNIVEATGTIIFDLNSRMGLHVGVLLSWWATNTALFPFCAWQLRRKILKHAKKSHH